MSIRVLMVENDFNLVAISKKRLEENGYEVEMAFDGTAGWRLFQRKKFDICLLDIIMPGLNGYELASKIREVNTSVPILFLTSRSVHDDVINGFKTGGDDYITKPFSFQELILRMEVFLRREKRAAGKTVYNIGDFILNMENLMLTRDCMHIDLSFKEIKILFMLAKNMNKTVKRTTIIEEIWGRMESSSEGSLDNLISRIRKLLEADQRVVIQSIRNVGYKLQVFDGII